jgi:hypothetical protein
MVRLEDDLATLCPGAELPDWLLGIIKNTHKGKEYLWWLWANVFPTVDLIFWTITRAESFAIARNFACLLCILALHPSDPACHLLTQDCFVDGKKPVPMFPMDMRRV